jgi:hypothetical protein
VCVQTIKREWKLKQTRGVSHCGLANYIKRYLNAKEELRKLKYFTMQKYNVQKILSKKPKSFRIRACPMLYRGILLGRRLRPENVHMLQGSKSIVAKSF